MSYFAESIQEKFRLIGEANWEKFVNEDQQRVGRASNELEQIPGMAVFLEIDSKWYDLREKSAEKWIMNAVLFILMETRLVWIWRQRHFNSSENLHFFEIGKWRKNSTDFSIFRRWRARSERCRGRQGKRGRQEEIVNWEVDQQKEEVHSDARRRGRKATYSGWRDLLKFIFNLWLLAGIQCNDFVRKFKYFFEILLLYSNFIRKRRIFLIHFSGSRRLRWRWGIRCDGRRPSRECNVTWFIYQQLLDINWKWTRPMK